MLSRAQMLRQQEDEFRNTPLKALSKLLAVEELLNAEAACNWELVGRVRDLKWHLEWEIELPPSPAPAPSDNASISPPLRR